MLIIMGVLDMETDELPVKNDGRGDWIRTSDLHTPSVMRYQAALRPDLAGASRQRQAIRQANGGGINRLRACRPQAGPHKPCRKLSGARHCRRRGAPRPFWPSRNIRTAALPARSPAESRPFPKD